LDNDLLLFENIILDLFPGVEKPEDDMGLLPAELMKSISHFFLQPHPYFINKVYQLYNTIQVRHGLMIVGPAGGGKTRNYKCL
jgi:dynein heavy chain